MERQSESIWQRIKTLILPFLVGAVAAFTFFAWVFTESGYHFYWAEGMTESQVIARYGEPLHRSEGIHDGAEYFQYYTGFLNFVDLKFQNGQVTQIDIRPDD